MDGFWLGYNQRVGAERLPVQNENYYFDAKMDDLISPLRSPLAVWSWSRILSQPLRTRGLFWAQLQLERMFCRATKYRKL